MTEIDTYLLHPIERLRLIGSDNLDSHVKLEKVVNANAGQLVTTQYS